PAVSVIDARGAPSRAKGVNGIIGYCLPDGMGAGLELARHRRRTCKKTPCCVVSSAPVPPLRTLFPFVALSVISCVCRLARRQAQRSVRQRPRAEGMPRDPRVEHL